MRCAIDNVIGFPDRDQWIWLQWHVERRDCRVDDHIINSGLRLNSNRALSSERQNRFRLSVRVCVLAVLLWTATIVSDWG